MATVKDIIIEAAARANLCPRKRAIPADLLESAFRLFNGIIQQYTYDNFVNYVRETVTVEKCNTKTEFDLDDMSSIVTVSVDDNHIQATPLEFVAYEQFSTEPNGYIYTWKYTDDGKVEMYVKDIVAGRNVQVVYNKKISYGLDDQLHIPPVYEELYTAALTYKLAVTHPRTDGSQVALLKSELESIERTVKALVSSNKILTRGSNNLSKLGSFYRGNFIF